MNSDKSRTLQLSLLTKLCEVKQAMWLSFTQKGYQEEKYYYIRNRVRCLLTFWTRRKLWVTSRVILLRGYMQRCSKCLIQIKTERKEIDLWQVREGNIVMFSNIFIIATNNNEIIPLTVKHMEVVGKKILKTFKIF